MTNINTIHDLCSELTQEFNKSGTLRGLNHILKRYHGIDWRDHIKFCDTYNKELVCRTDNFDIFIISWKRGQCTKIHDHPTQGCLMKMLEGRLNENLYQHKDDKITYVTSNLLDTNGIAYREDKVILHEILALTDAVSMHIYSPSGYQPIYY